MTQKLVKKCGRGNAHVISSRGGGCDCRIHPAEEAIVFQTIEPLLYRAARRDNAVRGEEMQP